MTMIVQFAAEDVDMIIVANKTDMEDSRKVKTAKGKQVTATPAPQINVLFT